MGRVISYKKAHSRKKIRINQYKMMCYHNDRFLYSLLFYSMSECFIMFFAALLFIGNAIYWLIFGYLLQSGTSFKSLRRELAGKKGVLFHFLGDLKNVLTLHRGKWISLMNAITSTMTTKITGQYPVHVIYVTDRLTTNSESLFFRGTNQNKK